ncbi:MAG: HPr family phosphocarrier protein [Planctomycetota bacterium]|nr:MAG: HPr family phosphocarrier protein [Planctomycetota bacterium]
MEPHYEGSVTIVNKYGLHARPAMKFVELAKQFASTISVSKDGEKVNGKSVLELMTLEGTCGSTLTIHAEGTDAQKAVEALVKLVKNKFDLTDEE